MKMKRFTDSEKWNDAWFSELSPKLKLAWLYCLDRCDMAGVFELSARIMSFNVGETISEEEFLLTFCDKIIQVPDSSSKYFIRNFIRFQYGELRETNKVHCSVMNKMVSHGLDPSLALDYKNNIPTPKEKDKDKDKDKDKAKDSDILGDDVNDSKSQKEKKPLPLHTAAMVEVCRLEIESLGANEFACAANIKRLALAKYPTEPEIAAQIRIRGQRYRSKYPNTELTVNALVKHWPALSDESLEKAKSYT